VISKPFHGEVTKEGPYQSLDQALEKLKLYEKVLALKTIPLSEDKITLIKIFGLPFEFWKKSNNLYWRIKWRTFKVFLDKWKKHLPNYKGFIIQQKTSEGIFITAIASVNGYLIKIIW